MKILYFVKPEDLNISEDEIIKNLPSPSGYTPNFVLSGEKRGADNKKIDDTTVAIKGSIVKESISSSLSKGAMMALASTGVPGAIILGSAWLGTSIYESVSNKSNGADADLKKELIEKNSENFIKENAITKRIATYLEYKFPPGHPRINRTYILHPLASDEKNQYHNLFIPYEKYDEILYEERESELIRLLVDLGATKIIIKDIKSNSRYINASAECGIDTLNKAGSISIDAAKKELITDGVERVFELTGKRFEQNDIINKEKFKWLNFEPSWNSIVVARHIGGCRKAEIILKQKTSFSAELNSETALRIAVASGKINTKYTEILDDDKQYIISIEFNEMGI